MADENKRLIPMTIAHTDDNNWRITVEGEDSYFVKGNIEDIKKVCRRIKAKDGENNNKCRSAKVGTYLSMVSNSDNDEHKINVWKSRVPHTAEDFKKLMESKTTDEQIRLDGVSDNVEYYIGLYEENGTLSKVQQKDLYDNLEILWVNNSYKNIYNLGVEVLNKCGYKNKLDLMESKKMKTITLTKNYIIEGAIIPKGTLVEFKEKEITVDDLNSLKNKIDSFVLSKGKAPSDLMKEYKNMIKVLGDSVIWSDDKEEWVLNESLKEKLDFLPSDIWEKAKNISDEHERFEFIKTELNKLGDTYSDDEIEDFINKYKSNLNESLTEKEVEGLGDMLDMLEETMESEDKVAKEDINKVLDVASGDKELLDKWEALSNATDKQFNKRENDFWNRFDEICVKVKNDSKEDKDNEKK